MQPVFLNSNNEQHNFQSFSQRFIEICNDHIREKRALVFAFVLYDIENAQIRSVLNNSFYWDSLHHISGKYLTVFTLNYKPVRRVRAISRITTDTPLIQYITQVNDYHNPSQTANRLIEQYFGEGINIKYPSVIFFQVNLENIIDYTIVELNEIEIEKSFHELQNYIAKVVKEMKYITEENKGNLQQIFNNTESIVKSEEWKNIAVRRIQKIIPIARFGASISRLGK